MCCLFVLVAILLDVGGSEWECTVKPGSDLGWRKEREVR